MTRREVGKRVLFSGIGGIVATHLPAADRSRSPQRDWLSPPALRRGDTVAFAAPAAPAGEKLVLAFAEILKKTGLNVRIPDGLFGRRSRYLGGTDAERAEELNQLIRDPKVRAIFPVRGGFGLTRILDRMDYDALRADPKIITGYSDLTALHLAVARQSRVTTFHSPLPMHRLGLGETAENAFSFRSFQQTILQPPRQGYDIPVPADSQPIGLVPGTARGRLLGGNLSLIASTIGTPYAIEPQGAILLLEDVHEAAYRVDRMLSQLRLAGVLKAVAGVVVGSFTTTTPQEETEVLAVVREYFENAKVPVVMNFPVGHGRHNVTLPHGAMVELNAGQGALRVLETPFSWRKS
ncbi:MAG: LD-carboxypeptidase [Bacteroidales bacterium]|nr:LD-carboxypeptidase [Bacteroidales bacterium]